MVPGTNYEFGTWVLNLNKAGSGLIPPNLAFQYNRFGVDDDGNGTVDEASEVATGLSTGQIAETSQPTWVRYRFLFNSGTATSVQFVLRNFAPGGGGNDISIDDVTLAPCTIPVSNSISGTVFADLDRDGIQDAGRARDRRRHDSPDQHRG